MIEQFVVALVGAPFGIKGFVKTKPLSGELEHLEQLETVVLRRENHETLFHIEETQIIGASLAMKFRGIDTPEAARTLSGAEILTDRDHAAPLGEDEYYVEDLRGIPVTDPQGTVLGEIRDVLEGGGGQLIELKLNGGELRLVPFRKEFFGEVDTVKRRAVLLEQWILE
ncbi:ribosome maturation factor RimM [Treponema primitia]|uniref:ribosome maturation factor RimM n=1 Tax=Treponema primitia TaxID=88058 RepID=UPI00025555AE|nr:ribosome maturation factor RimM [Treponema primitia]